MVKAIDIFIWLVNVYVLLVSKLVVIPSIDMGKLLEGILFIISLYAGQYMVKRLEKAGYLKRFEQKSS